MKKIKNFFENIFVQKAGHPAWTLSAIVLLIIFGAIALNNFLPKSLDTKPAAKKLFMLPVTVIYNKNSEDQKTKMERFVASLGDPATALQDTELQTKWLDSKSPEAQTLLAQSKLKYLPQIFLDKSIEQHPQFENLKSYLNQLGNFYYMRLAPLEHLSIPPLTERRQVAGADVAKAKVIIQAYQSYMCDDCAKAHETLKKVLKNYPDTVAVVYKNFASEKVSQQLAESAECAADQNKFSQMQDAIFKGEANILSKLKDVKTEEEALTTVGKLIPMYAKTAGLKLKDFQACLDAKTYAKAIDDETLTALDYGINQAPAFFINKQYHSGLLSYDEFKTIIDQQL